MTEETSKATTELSLKSILEAIIFASGEPILITRDWVTEKGIPIYALKWLLTQEGKER